MMFVCFLFLAPATNLQSKSVWFSVGRLVSRTHSAREKTLRGLSDRYIYCHYFFLGNKHQIVHLQPAKIELTQNTQSDEQREDTPRLNASRTWKIIQKQSCYRLAFSLYLSLFAFVVIYCPMPTKRKGTPVCRVVHCPDHRSDEERMKRFKGRRGRDNNFNRHSTYYVRVEIFTLREIYWFNWSDDCRLWSSVAVSDSGCRWYVGKNTEN